MVAQAYKVEVEVLGASRGCTAVLRCVVPSFVKDLIRVMSWVQEPSFYVYPLLQGGKPGHQTPLDVLRAYVTDRTHIDTHTRTRTHRAECTNRRAMAQRGFGE